MSDHASPWKQRGRARHRQSDRFRIRRAGAPVPGENQPRKVGGGPPPGQGNGRGLGGELRREIAQNEIPVGILPAWVLQVEADGYEPTFTRPYYFEEGDQHLN